MRSGGKRRRGTKMEIHVGRKVGELALVVGMVIENLVVSNKR